MRSSVVTNSTARLREEVASVRPQMIQAGLTPQPSATSLRVIAGEAIEKAHGKAETAAGILGLHRAHVGRLVNDGDLKLKQMEALGADMLVRFARGILNEYEPMVTPLERLRENHRRQRELQDEAMQIAEGLSS